MLLARLSALFACAGASLAADSGLERRQASSTTTKPWPEPVPLTMTRSSTSTKPWPQPVPPTSSTLTRASTTKPWPQPVPPTNSPAPRMVENGVVRDAECKNCPYLGCLNAGVLWENANATFSCWTQGEMIGNQKLWLKYQFGLRTEDFCYVNTYDLLPRPGDYKSALPYCGTKSELSFYLPTAKVKTIFYTECSICPYRDCDGVKFYPPGSSLDVNCQVLDGWNQFGPLHVNGTRQLLRLPEHSRRTPRPPLRLHNHSVRPNNDNARPAALLRPYPTHQHQGPPRRRIRWLGLGRRHGEEHLYCGAVGWASESAPDGPAADGVWELGGWRPRRAGRD
ncbi:hypothetical protein EJ06DRAFT_522040 [Trichodelitschia bisporula]|uniref:Uncharacterized protein n=1 Tax=Trichodelitschia bisporula TaxID=703511 RepID=A0A6G1HUV5_9PEZI|nr:hypothetical protein EJ06DRAFT_522040 [Trichodelitschia bisporula]